MQPTFRLENCYTVGKEEVIHKTSKPCFIVTTIIILQQSYRNNSENVWTLKENILLTVE